MPFVAPKISFLELQQTKAEQEATEDLADWVREDLDRILAEHEPEALPQAVDDEIEAILTRFGANP